MNSMLNALVLLNSYVYLIFYNERDKYTKKKQLKDI